MKIKLVFFIILINPWLFTKLNAKDSGSFSGTVLTLPTSARAFSMGEVYSFVDKDIGIMHYNPAGLSGVNRKEISMFFRKGLEEDVFGNLMFGVPFLKGNLAVGICYFDAGNVDLIDSYGNEWSKKAEQDYVYTLSYGFSLYQWISLGMNLKYFSSTLIEEYKATTFASDFGVLIYLNRSTFDKFRVGASISNLGRKMKYISENESLPQQFRLSLGYTNIRKIDSLLFGMEFEHNITNDVKLLNFGGEYGYQFGEKITGFIRMGQKTNISNENITGSTTSGFGIGWDKFFLDYAIGFSKDLDNTHNIVIRYYF